MTDQLKRAISAAKTAQSNSEITDSVGIASSSAGDQNFDMSESSYKTSHTAVRKARRFAMQGLYEWLITDRRFDTTGKLGWKANAPHDIAARTRASNAMHTVHIGYYHEMMRDIPEQIEALDTLIGQHLDREIDKLDTVEHAILLIGAYELQNRLEIPYKVVLDEAMKLNNHFGATDAHKLINAVLDRMAIELRDVEVQADTKANLRTSQKPVTKQAVVAPAAQIDTVQDTTNTEVDINSENKLTASTKPRISANNTTIKRNRSNKANAGMSIKEAAAHNMKVQEESATPAADDVINNTVENITTADVAVDNEVVTESATNERTVSDSTVADNAASIKIDTDSVETPLETESSVTEESAVKISIEDTKLNVSAIADAFSSDSIDVDSDVNTDSDTDASDDKSND